MLTELAVVCRREDLRRGVAILSALDELIAESCQGNVSMLALGIQSECAWS